MQKITLVAILILSAVYLVIIRPVLGDMQIKQMDESIETNKKILSRFLLEDQVLPSKTLYESIKTEQDKMEGDYKQLVDFLDSKFDNLPKGAQSGLFFKESVFALEKKLDRQSKGAGVSIPDSLGFGTELPTEEELPRLLRQINLVDMLVTSLISEGAQSIDDIKLLDFDRSVERDFDEIPVEVKANISNEGLIRTLYSLYTAQPAINIDNLTVKRINGNLEVDIIASGFIFKTRKDAENKALP